MASLREEEYLEAVFSVVSKKGYAKVNDVASILGVAPSSVTEMFKRLAQGGYLNYEKYSGVTLTQSGERLASRLRKRHEIIRELLIVMGVEESIADEDACRIEHNIHGETIDRIALFLEKLKGDGSE